MPSAGTLYVALQKQPTIIGWRKESGHDPRLEILVPATGDLKTRLMAPVGQIRWLPVEWRQALILFAATRLVLTVVGVVARGRLGHADGETLQCHYAHCAALDIWGVVDSKFYMRIAQHGYSPYLHADMATRGTADYAFFPLYPFLVRILSWILHSPPFLPGLLISNGCLLVAGVFLYRLVRIDYDERAGLHALQALFLFPMAFILSAFYSEALFLCLVVLSFYCARRQWWLWACVLGCLASLTRAPGVLLFPALVWEYLAARDFQFARIETDCLLLLLVPLGLFEFASYCYWLTGDFLGFIHIQAVWGRHAANPLLTLVSSLGSQFAMDGWLTLLFLTLVIIWRRKLRFSYWLFAILSILCPLSTGTAMSMARYLVPVFPIYLLYGCICQSRTAHALALTACVMFQVYLMFSWTTVSLMTM